jgi:hypothetical protein
MVQLPVRSRIQPNATGDRMPATAPAAFVSALALPVSAVAMAASLAGRTRNGKRRL